jgi:DNA-binding XRE family transcriptional regulator
MVTVTRNQKDVSRICGVSEDCIINWEKNRNAPQIQYYPRIINFLGYLPFNIDLTTLPGKLKAHRYIKGLSQNQLGKILSVDGATVVAGNWKKTNPIRQYWQS